MLTFRYFVSTIRRKLLLVAILSSFFRPVSADIGQEYAVRAGLAANFARFTTWPESALANMGESMMLCLIGNPALEEAFINLNGKRVGDKAIEVRYLTRLNNLHECQLLYISDLEKNKLSSVLNDIKSLPILTVGEDDYFVTHGGMVSIQVVDSKPTITINLNAVKRSNLSISARVLKLAKVIQ